MFQAKIKAIEAVVNTEQSSIKRIWSSSDKEVASYNLMFVKDN